MTDTDRRARDRLDLERVCLRATVEATLDTLDTMRAHASHLTEPVSFAITTTVDTLSAMIVADLARIADALALFDALVPEDGAP